MVSCWVSNGEGRTTPLAAQTLVPCLGLSRLPIQFRPRTERFSMRKAAFVLAGLPLAIRALQLPDPDVFFNDSPVVLQHGFLTAGTTCEVLLVAGSLNGSTREVGVGDRKLQATPVAWIRMNTELSALRIPAEVHIHPKKRQRKAPFRACRGFLRDIPHLSSPF